MKRIFIVILIFLNVGSIAIAQVDQQQVNDDVEYGVVDLITSIKLSINKNKSVDDSNLKIKNKINSIINNYEDDKFVNQILKKILFIILKGKDPPKYKYQKY